MFYCLSTYKACVKRNRSGVGTYKIMQCQRVREFACACACVVVVVVVVVIHMKSLKK
jgi:hypothetical protein